MVTQSKINGFLNKKLNDTELEEFLLHIHDCAECKEELEVQYILSEAMKKMDRDEDISCNFHEDLHLLIDGAQSHMRKKKRMNRIVLVTAFLLFVMASVLAVMGILDLGGRF